MLPAGLDPELLRSFVLIAEGNSVTRAAQRVGRTQSAVSMQVKRLEEALGTPLFQREPGGLVPTARGAWLLERARTVLSLNAEIIASFRAAPITGEVCLGSPDDYTLQWLPGILARFAESHPGIEVDVLCMSSEELVRRLRSDKLDLALVTEGHGVVGEEAVARAAALGRPGRHHAAPARPAAAGGGTAGLHLAPCHAGGAGQGRAAGADHLQQHHAVGLLRLSRWPGWR
jgi:DNA-binding transcriptional LysR family regulator